MCGIPVAGIILRTMEQHGARLAGCMKNMAIATTKAAGGRASSTDLLQGMPTATTRIATTVMDMDMDMMISLSR